jgi:hypothetical protein
VTADQDVNNNTLGISPTDPTGYQQYWMVAGRARTVLGNLLKKGPFTRSWTVNGVTTNVAATPSEYDHSALATEQVSWRYVDSKGNVRDLHDMLLVWWEWFIQNTPPAQVSAAVVAAQGFRAWPAGYTGAASFDGGGTPVATPPTS